MRFIARSLRAVPGFMVAFGLVWLVGVSTASATTPTVMIIDNDAPPPSRAFDAGQGWWGYAPGHIEVHRGDKVLFNNPSSGKLPHTITSIRRSGEAFENQLEAATKFDSSPSREGLVTPGNSWMLDTGDLDKGHYAYYCRLHPWMIGSLTVLED